MQLDELIEHAQFHKQEHGDSFIVFLSKHYGELKAEHTKNHQEEQNDHEQLPFQCQGYSVSMVAFLSHITSYNINRINFYSTTESNFHYINLYASLIEKEFLQPPRKA
ncbi:hypothetical protein [Winogradskyella sp.]|jgi:hypothetical protein|uniref:hypothetical protein n=1 Tax=Winogradskyella sp. TaxID=1883156 RepID=UPI0025DCBB76|nr:hypothetical protein [Winogradskyella sp.]